MKIRSFFLIALLWGASLDSTAAQERPLTLTVIHVNDTHSHFDPAQTKLAVDWEGTGTAKPVYVELGGFAHVADTIRSMRNAAVNPLVLHAGDFFQGTLYFTQSVGVADTEFWNLVGLDAATLGNHEFDKGPAILRSNLLRKANFPIVDANLDLRGEPTLVDANVAPSIVQTIDGQKVAIVGAVTPETPFISSPGEKIRFLDPIASVQKAVDEVTARGIDKVVVVSHLGYEADLKLAQSVRGVDVVVGGHSHSLLGAWSSFGWTAGGEYPTAVKRQDGKTALVVQAWEWAKVVGELQISFDARGDVQSWKGRPVAVVAPTFVRAYDVANARGELERVQFSFDGSSIAVYNGKDWTAPTESLERYRGVWANLSAFLQKQPNLKLAGIDPRANELTKLYSAKVRELKSQVAAQVGQDLVRGLQTGPGFLVADAYRAKTGSAIGISNPGGIRTDVLQGPLTVAGVYELIPFGNTLVTVQADAANLKKILEDGIDFSVSRFGDSSTLPLIYVSGIRIVVDVKKPKGERVVSIELVDDRGVVAKLDSQKSYTVTVNNFMANGGDRYDTLKQLPVKIDTGFVDAEALLDFVRGKTIVEVQPRVRIVAAAVNPAAPRP